MLEQKLYQTALTMARRGATRGMILQKLKAEQVDDLMANMVVDRAFQTVAMRTRIAGLGKMMLGAAVIGLALYSRTFFEVKVPIVLAMIGILIFGLGVLQLFKGQPT